MWYQLFVWLHILAVAIWIGGMLFISYAVLPLIRHPSIFPIRAVLLTELGLRIRLVGWITLGVLLLTGTGMLLLRGHTWSDLISAAFWQSATGTILGWKLGLFALTVITTLAHDLYFGPKSARLAEQLPEDHPQRQRIRRISSWLGRIVVLLALAISFLGVLLSRGW